MLFILYGEDTYHSRNKLNTIICEYRNKAGSDLNVHRIDCEEKDITLVKELCRGESLFYLSKLIVVENFLHDAVQCEGVFPTLGALCKDSDPMIVLWERGLTNTQEKKYGKIFCLGKTQKFPLLTGAAKNKFIEEGAKNRGISLTVADKERLAACADSWGIINMLDGLLLLREEKKNTSPGSNNSSLSIYTLGDTFFSSNRSAPIATLLGLFYRGEDGFSIFSYMANYTRTLILAKSFAARGEPIPSSLGIHPYVAKKASFAARSISLQELVYTHKHFFEEDFRIKTGISNPRDSLLTILSKRSHKPR